MCSSTCVWLLHEHHTYRKHFSLSFCKEGGETVLAWPLSDSCWLQITGCNWPCWWAGSRQWKRSRKDRDPFNEANEKDTESLQASRWIRAGPTDLGLWCLHKSLNLDCLKRTREVSEWEYRICLVQSVWHTVVKIFTLDFSCFPSRDVNKQKDTQKVRVSKILTF